MILIKEDMKRIYTAALLIAVLAGCKKDDTTESTNTKHTIYYEATIESTGDVAFTHIVFKVFNADSNTVYIDSLKTDHFVSDTMTYTDENNYKFVDTYFAAACTATAAGKLTIRTVVDGKVREMTATGTEMETSDSPRWVFD